MNYSNKDKFGMEQKLNDKENILWEHSSYNDDFERRDVMSQLDKLTLNLLWAPAIHKHYKPTTSKLSDMISMYYCGRQVMKGHNYPFADNKKLCGCNKNPKMGSGPNCTSCRTIKNGDLKMLKNQKQLIVWQGYSGYFYCGREFKHGINIETFFRGPDYGRPCPECLQLINCKYESDTFDISN
eukprot:703871_1